MAYHNTLRIHICHHTNTKKYPMLRWNSGAYHNTCVSIYATVQAQTKKFKTQRNREKTQTKSQQSTTKRRTTPKTLLKLVFHSALKYDYRAIAPFIMYPQCFGGIGRAYHNTLRIYILQLHEHKKIPNASVELRGLP
jgi:hypothetical protein